MRQKSPLSGRGLTVQAIISVGGMSHTLIGSTSERALDVSQAYSLALAVALFGVWMGRFVDAVSPASRATCCRTFDRADGTRRGQMTERTRGAPPAGRHTDWRGTGSVARNGAVLLLGLALTAAAASGQDTWRGLVVAPESRCSPYRADDYAYPQAVETRVVGELGGVYSPYTGQCFGTTWETDIEHMIARSEAHDSGLCAATAAVRRQFATDPLNLTLADPGLNRHRKGDKDAAEWLPAQNTCWFADRVVRVRQKYGLTVDRREAETLDSVLRACQDVRMAPPACQTNRLDRVGPPDFTGPFDILIALWRAIAPYLGW